MADRVSEGALSFDPEFVRSLIRPEASNLRQMQLVRRVLRDVIATELTPRQREVILLRYYDGLRVGEIAEQLGIDHSSVSKLLDRAHRRIYRHMRYLIDNCRAGMEEEE